jgi:hypothetical protein
MSTIGPLYTGLSVLALPGQPPTNTESPTATDTWSVTEPAESSAVAQVISTTDTWSEFLVLEGGTVASFLGTVDVSKRY